MTTFVTVGTDHHPFDRLMGWVERWVAVSGVPCRVQHGTSRAPAGTEAVPYLETTEMARAIAEATVVVCHGGPGTIMAARAAGAVPLVVARRHALGEHVDDHQVRFTERIAGTGLIRLVNTEPEFVEALQAGVADPGSLRTPAAGRDDEVAARIGALIAELVGDRPARRTSPLTQLTNQR